MALFEPPVGHGRNQAMQGLLLTVGRKGQATPEPSHRIGTGRSSTHQQQYLSYALSGVSAAVAAFAISSKTASSSPKRRNRSTCAAIAVKPQWEKQSRQSSALQTSPSSSAALVQGALRKGQRYATCALPHHKTLAARGVVVRKAMELDLPQLASELSQVSDPAALAAAFAELSGNLLGPVQPAFAAADEAAGASPSPLDAAWQEFSAFFFNPRLQWDANGNILLDPKGEPLPDNLWTQFVAVQATLMQRLTEGLIALGVPQPFGWAVVCYTLGVRLVLFPLVKEQLETTAKMQVLSPRVKELKEKHKDDEDTLNREVGMLFMDLQVDPLQAFIPLLLQLPIFWGLYRAIRRLAIVQYEPLQQGWLWIPSTYGPGFSPDPDLSWVLNWQGPLINLHPTIGWELFGLYAILPTAIFIAYKQVLAAATEDKDSPKILEFFPYMLAFITIELPQAMGLYIATNIASSVTLTNYSKAQLAAKIPGYDEFVETGKWPPGVDPERVLAKAFGVQRLTSDGLDLEDPKTVPEAIVMGRADFLNKLVKEEGRNIDEYDERGIMATAYTVALDNPDLLERLFDSGADPCKKDKKGNTLLHYAAGYGREKFLDLLLTRFDKSSDLINTTNGDGQTALDVARINLQQEKVADAVRNMIPLLEEAGGKGKLTTKDDESKMEELREQNRREKQLKSARSALVALAKGAAAAQKEQEAEASPASASSSSSSSIGSVLSQAVPMINGDAAKAKAEEEERVSSQTKEFVEGKVAESLERIKSLDRETLKQKFGSNLSEEQLDKLVERVASMSSTELVAFAATGQSSSGSDAQDGAPGEAAQEEAAARASASAAQEKKVVEKKEEREPARTSVIVD